MALGGRSSDFRANTKIDLNFLKAMSMKNSTVGYEEHRTADKDPYMAEVNELKQSLEGWRETLLPLNRLFNWDKPYYPAVILMFTSFLFMMIWYFDTSILTTFCIIGLLITMTDFLVPIIGPSVLGSRQWTGIQERQFEQICVRIYNFRNHMVTFWEGVCNLKEGKPKLYFILVVVLLSLIAWITSSINNLLLTYLTVTFILLLPGLRRHSVIQKYVRSLWNIIKSNLSRKKEVKKEK